MKAIEIQQKWTFGALELILFWTGKKSKRPEKILRILGQVSKINQGMLGSLSRTGFFHTADDSRSACAQNNIYIAILMMVLYAHQIYDGKISAGAGFIRLK